MVIPNSPRKTPMSGHRKATETYCNHCMRWHRTHRHVLGKETCAKELIIELFGELGNPNG